MSQIVVDYEKDLKEFTLTFRYNEAIKDLVKSKIPVCSFNKILRAWTVPELLVETIDFLPGKRIDLAWTDRASSRKVLIQDALYQLIDCKFIDSSDEENRYEYDYQDVGVKFLKMAKKALLADDMGLGKTIQALKAIIELETKSNLILVPATLMWNWYNEFQKHFNITPTVIQGVSDIRKQQWKDIGAIDNDCFKYIIMSYDGLNYDWNFMPHEWDSIICDEAVYLKNYKSKRTKLVKDLHANVRIALSGTPIENKIEDLYSIMEWVRPDILPNWWVFDKRYIIKDYFKKHIGYKNLEELNYITSPYILRREKKDVLKSLPDKIHMDFPLDFSDSAKIEYDAICKQLISWLQNETGNLWQTDAMSQLHQLRKFVEFPKSIGFNSDSVKLNWLLETYENLDKMVVFTPYIDSVRFLKEKFGTDFVITGDTNSADRVNIVDKFNEADKGVFILTDAGRFGLNITGASYLVNFGYFYNPATMVQREDRLHRIGQQNTVHILNPYIRGSIDEGIRDIFRNRGFQSQSFMEGSEQMCFDRLGRQDIIKMIKGGMYSNNDSVDE